MQARIWASGAVLCACLATTPTLASPLFWIVREPSSPLGFDVDLADCTEIVSVTTVLADKVRKFVPKTYQLVEDGTNALLAVRVVDCNSVSVAGAAPNHEVMAEIGTNIVAPDGTGDINNYTIWYDTTSANLAARLLAVGVPVRLVPALGFHYIPDDDGSGGSLNVSALRSANPSFEEIGSVIEPKNPPIPYNVGWWGLGYRGKVKMETTIPMIQFGTAHLTLTTNPENDLGKLIGGGTTQFSVLDNFNHFSTAHMTVRVSL